MKEAIDTINAVPSKRLYLSIIVDYDINRAICELVDNALDNWTKKKKSKRLDISILLDINQQTINVTDNSGGVKKEDLKNIVAPGETGNESTKGLIGIFGVGTKRAVVALSQDVKIRTRHKNGKTHLVEFDDSWLNTDEWELQVYKVDPISEGTTSVDLQRLRYVINEDVVKKLYKHLSEVYGLLLSHKKLHINVNGKNLSPRTFDVWAYPPKYEPREFKTKITTEHGDVKLRIVTGLKTKSSPAAGKYGAYFYCNDRLVAGGVKDFQVGFSTGVIGLPHPSVSLVQALIFLKGDARVLPWNSSKSAINYNNKVFKALRKALIELLKHYASLSRRWEGSWTDKVSKFTSGTVKTIPSKKVLKALPSYLPPLPKSKLRYIDKVKKKNETIVEKKPWARGLSESIVAVDVISRQRLEEKNRISLILLDSTLEIAFKEYLVNESGNHYSDKQIASIFANRYNVHTEVKKYTKGKISGAEWKKIKHYYDLRCKLIHERATVGITKTQVSDFRGVVQKILKLLFSLSF